MNKKASKWMSPYLFFIFFIVGIFIVIGVVLFYSVTPDIREEETKFITNKLVGCLSKDNNFFIPEENFDYYTECKLNKEILNNGNYYISLNLIKSEEEIELFETGVKDLELRCELGIKGELPNCNEINLTINPQERIKLFVASNNIGETV